MRLTCPKCGAVTEGDPGAGLVCDCGQPLGANMMPQTQILGQESQDDSYVPFSGDQVTQPGSKEPGETGYEEATNILPGNAPSNMPTAMVPESNPGEAPTAMAPTGGPQGADADSKTQAVDPNFTPTRASDAPKPTPSAAPSSGGAHGENLVGRRLGGYAIKRLLGAGGMGAVYLADQISLDREVAIKVLPGRFAKDPAFLSRFIREALAAGHLNHHNIIQVYDVGNDGDTHFIVMEFVKGRDIGSIIRKEGKLHAEDAAGYCLQAARGLHYAHENGFIHRDIKPDNLMLNDLGIVKIADMGLAKKVGTVSDETQKFDPNDPNSPIHQSVDPALTQANMAMGTPAYMSPEQGKDAGSVDHRADQYSLGCTLYYMVAGKTPFTGKTTFEIISKHASEPLIPLDQHVKNVPKELSYIIEKMLAKQRQDRYASMQEVVEALEAYLGVETAQGGEYRPREQHVAVLERQQQRYYSEVKGLALVKAGLAAFPAFCLALFIAGLYSGGYYGFLSAAGALGVFVLTPIFNLLLAGIFQRNYLFRRIKNSIFGLSFMGWIKSAAVLVIILGGLFISGLLVPWIVVSVLALGLAFGWRMFVLRPIAKQREEPLAETQEMLKQLRIRGVSEDALQDFICRFSGVHWEQFFEELFGYEDMIAMRIKWAKREQVKPRKRYGTWRDPIIRWLDDIDEARRAKKEQAKITKAEKNRLTAEGKSEAEAEKEASELADKTVKELKKAKLDAEMRQSVELNSKEYNKRHRKGGMIFWGFRIARMALALFMIAGTLAPVAAAQGAGVPEFVVSFFNGIGYLGAQQAYMVYFIVPAFMLLLTVISSRWFLPSIVFLGCLTLTLYNHVAGLFPIPAQTLYYSAIGASVLGFLMMAGLKLMGKKF